MGANSASSSSASFETVRFGSSGVLQPEEVHPSR